VTATGLRELLAGRNFRHLLGTRLLGQFSDGLLQAALATFVLFSPERQPTAAGVASAFAILLLPYSVIGPFAGVLLDRWRRRTVLVRANLLRGVSVLAIVALVAAGSTSWQLGLAVLVTVGIGRFVLAGLSAALPHTVAPGQLVLANSVKPTMGTIAYGVGAIAGVAIRGAAGGGDWGSVVVLICTTATYLAAGLVAARIPVDALGPTAGKQRRTAREAGTELVRGFVELHADRAAWKSLVVVAVNRVLFGALTVTLLLVLRNRIHPPDQADAALADFALIAGFVTLGAFAAAVLTPFFGRRLGPVLWTAATATLAGLLLPPAMLAVAVLPLLFAAPLAGLANQSAKICCDTILQRRVPDEALGRVFSIVDLTVNAGLVVGVTLVAFLAPPDGVSVPLFLGIGALYLLVALWYVLTRERSLDDDPVLEVR
jgi:MFS family permease